MTLKMLGCTRLLVILCCGVHFSFLDYTAAFEHCFHASDGGENHTVSCQFDAEKCGANDLKNISTKYWQCFSDCSHWTGNETMTTVYHNSMPNLTSPLLCPTGNKIYHLSFYFVKVDRATNLSVWLKGLGGLEFKLWNSSDWNETFGLVNVTYRDSAFWLTFSTNSMGDKAYFTNISLTYAGFSLPPDSHPSDNFYSILLAVSIVLMVVGVIVTIIACKWFATSWKAIKAERDELINVEGESERHVSSGNVSMVSGGQVSTVPSKGPLRDDFSDSDSFVSSVTPSLFRPLQNHTRPPIATPTQMVSTFAPPRGERDRSGERKDITTSSNSNSDSRSNTNTPTSAATNPPNRRDLPATLLNADRVTANTPNQPRPRYEQLHDSDDKTESVHYYLKPVEENIYDTAASESYLADLGYAPGPPLPGRGPTS